MTASAPTAAEEQVPPPPRRRPRRRRFVVGYAALGGLLVWILVGLPIFVWPATGPLPRHADVALVLGDDTPQRIALAERLLAEHRVDAMLWSTPTHPFPTPDAVLRRCREGRGLTCFVPDPSTTQGEARELRAQAAVHGWTSAIVITQAAHIVRARTIVARCFSGRLTMAVSGEPPEAGWVHEYLYQTAATIKMWLHPGC